MDAEKIAFLNLKKLNITLIKVKSHLSFLNICRENNVIPNGLISDFSISAAQPSEDLDNKLKTLANDNSLKIIDFILDHYMSIISKMENEKAELIDTLKNITRDHERFDYLVTCIQEFNDREDMKCTGRKKKKINRLKENEPKLADLKNCQTKKSDEDLWISSLNLGMTEKEFLISGENICDRLIDAGMKLLQKKFPFFTFQSACFNDEQLVYDPFPTIHIHHTGINHFVTSTSIGGAVRVFDSLNMAPTEKLISEIKVIYSPDQEVSPTIIHKKVASTQEGQNDCGLFALAYAAELARNEDPSSKIFDQSKMRQHFFECLESGFIIPFPIKRINATTPREEEITKQIHPNNKWTFPKKTCSGLTDKNLKKDIPLSNRFCILNKQNKYQKANKTRKEPKGLNDCRRKKPFKNHQNQSGIYNLSKHVITEDEKSVLELGLSFTPSQKNYNKNSL